MANVVYAHLWARAHKKCLPVSWEAAQCWLNSLPLDLDCLGSNETPTFWLGDSMPRVLSCDTGFLHTLHYLGPSPLPPGAVGCKGNSHKPEALVSFF